MLGNIDLFDIEFRQLEYNDRLGTNDILAKKLIDMFTKLINIYDNKFR